LRCRVQNRQADEEKDLAEKRGIAESYVRKIMNLNYLSPKIKELILDGKHPKHLKLQDLMADIPVLWSEQEEMFLR
jgi:site-specific DNA recombinase